MSGKTAIEWSDMVWNPVTGCAKVSPGCAHCYIERTPPFRMQGRKFERGAIPVLLHEDRLSQPLKWSKPRRVFVNSLSDLFHVDVPDEYIDKVFAVMALTPQHTYQVLTKRPERMQEYMSGRWNTGGYAVESAADRIAAAKEWCWPGLSDWPLPNVWLGVTVENQHFADERIPILLDTPAAVRFISAEPLLERVTLIDHLYRNLRPTTETRVHGGRRQMKFTHEGPSGLNWVIVGGESGPGFRPFDPEWARSIVRQCDEAGTRVFIKQMGGTRPGNRLEDLPSDLQIREFPDGSK